MTPNGRTRLWMGLALGSVLAVGLSAGLLADRLLGERQGGERKRPHVGPRHVDRPHDGGVSMFHFDCRSREDSDAATAADATPPSPLDQARSEARSEEGREHGSRVTRRLARHLELDPDQIEALEPIVAEAMERGRRYWVGARDDFCAMEREFHRQVGELLRPEQAALFDEMRRKTRGPGYPPHGNRSDGESSGPRKGPPEQGQSDERRDGNDGGGNQVEPGIRR